MSLVTKAWSVAFDCVVVLAVVYVSFTDGVVSSLLELDAAVLRTAALVCGVVLWQYSTWGRAARQALVVCGILDADTKTTTMAVESSPPNKVTPEPPPHSYACRREHLDLMKEVVHQIQNNEDFARSIYSNCPRLQGLLRKHPEIRPLYEDPKFVLINFEKVYRDALLETIQSHWLFFIFRLLTWMKRPFQTLLSSPTKHYGISNEDVITRLSSPDLQLQINEAMHDSYQLQKLVQQHAELRQLRDSNPLCAEMMRTPETFRIISNPTNLRAIGSAPQLIELDFAESQQQEQEQGETTTSQEQSPIPTNIVDRIVDVVVIQQQQRQQQSSPKTRLFGFVAGFGVALAMGWASTLQTNGVE